MALPETDGRVKLVAKAAITAVGIASVVATVDIGAAIGTFRRIDVRLFAVAVGRNMTRRKQKDTYPTPVS
jgi:hypothetical protein